MKFWLNSGKNNRGVSEARNAGLAVMKGEYITFVDSDDEIAVNSLKPILELIEAENLDVFYPRLHTYDEDGNIIGIIPVDDGSEHISSGLKAGRRTYPATFYRREILANLRFSTFIPVGEDTVFNAMVQARAEKVLYRPITYYKYYVREHSLSKQGSSEKAFQGFLKAIIELRNFEKQVFADDKDARIYFDKLYIIFVTRILELNIMPGWHRERYQKLKSLLNEEELSYILDFLADKYPYVNCSFFKFKSWQQYLGIKSAIYKLIYRG